MNQKNILVLFPCPQRYRQALLTVAEGHRVIFKTPSEDYREELKTAHIVIGEPKNQEFPLCRNLELLHSPCSGVNYYVQGGMFPNNAMLCCATGAYGPIIAEHMLAMTLSLCRRLPEYRDQQHRREWKLLTYDKQLSGSTVLILGAGDIGTTLAKWLRPMVGRIIGVRRTVREYPDCYDEMLTLAQLDDHLAEADFILCALPQTPETVGLLNRQRLGRMKPNAVLVNGGRGSLIDQDALCDALDAGRFWGVGLEVTSPEPLPSDHPLWTKDRVLITPHAAGNSFAPDSPLVDQIWEQMMPNVAAFLRGEAPGNQVDFATGYCAHK